MALRSAVSARVTERPDSEAALDARSSGALNQVTSATVKVCLPSGTKKPFHRNCLSLMTMSWSERLDGELFTNRRRARATRI